MDINKLIPAVFLLCISFQALTQPIEIGAFGGVAIYSGDLSETEFGVFLDDAKPAYGLFLRLPLAERLGLRLHVNTGEMAGRDMNTERNFSFRTRFTEVGLAAEYALFQTGSSGTFRFSPKLFAGAGFFRFDPEGLYEGEWVALQPLGTEGQGLPGYPAPYELTHVNVPMGIQFELNFSDRVKLGLEFGGRKLFTDYLDDISAQSVVYRDVLEGNGMLAAQLSNPLIDPEGDIDINYQRGGSFNDWYWVSGVTIAVALGDFGGGGGRRQGGCYEF